MKRANAAHLLRLQQIYKEEKTISMRYVINESHV